MKHFENFARNLTRCGSVAVLLAAAGAAFAQPYPNRVVKLVSQFPPGGGTDLVARIVAPELEKLLGQSVIVENKVGAAGNIGAEFVAKSAPDGYTILVANNTIVTNPSLQKTPFDVTKDFAPITVVGATAIALAVHPSVPAKSVKELIEMVKKDPAKFSYSSCGNGTAMHLAGELFKQVAGISMVHIPYKGCGPAIIDGISGQVPILFNTITNTSPQAKGGKLRILAIASATRSPVDEQIPTIAEAGFAGFDADIWFGFLAPANTPRDIVIKLNDAVSKVVAMPEVQAKMKAQLFSSRASTPDDFAKVIQSDLSKWSKLVKEAKIQAE
ncbi:MAG: tripartite tricarboxylate transporter substrate binding protein [Burkholderiaceae bacterium]|nr:tripartite tricarboxylate transporter substrate binding protein [Burkholderiaceae bacterium]